MTPVVIAHRTCPLHTAENSLQGIRLAAQFKSDAVEVDIRLTSDRIPILMHDRTLRRTTGAWGPTRAHSLAALRRLSLSNGESIPTFAEALDALPAALRMAIEIKAPRAIGPVLDEIRNQSRQQDVMIWSQHQSPLRIVADRERDIAAFLLRDTSTDRGDLAFLRAAQRCNARGISAHWQSLTPTFAARAHAMGLRIYSWCRTRTPSLDQLRLLDGVVTDWPADALNAIHAAIAK